MGRERYLEQPKRFQVVAVVRQIGKLSVMTAIESEELIGPRQMDNGALEKVLE